MEVRLGCIHHIVVHLLNCILGDYVGGELYYSAGVSVISDIPSRAHWPVKLQGWVNAGRLDEINRGTEFHCL